MTWVEQGLAYIGKGEAPRDAIAGAVGLGKSTVTLEVLAQMAQGVTVHYYSPTLELGEEIVAKAKTLGLDAVLVRGREENKKDPVRWPALCQKSMSPPPSAASGGNFWESLCRKQDDSATSPPASISHRCPYVRQFDDLEGKLVVLAHEYLTLPKALIAKPALAVVDERFHTTLLRARLTAAGASDRRPAVSLRRGGGRGRGRTRSRCRHGHPRCRGRQDHGRGRAHARAAPQDGPDRGSSWPNRRPSGPICPMPSSAAAPNGCRRSKRSGWPSCGGCLPRTMTASASAW